MLEEPAHDYVGTMLGQPVSRVELGEVTSCWRGGQRAFRLPADEEASNGKDWQPVVVLR